MAQQRENTDETPRRSPGVPQETQWHFNSDGDERGDYSTECPMMVAVHDGTAERPAILLNHDLCRNMQAAIWAKREIILRVEIIDDLHDRYEDLTRRIGEKQGIMASIPQKHAGQREKLQKEIDKLERRLLRVDEERDVHQELCRHATRNNHANNYAVSEELERIFVSCALMSEVRNKRRLNAVKEESTRLNFGLGWHNNPQEPAKFYDYERSVVRTALRT